MRAGRLSLRHLASPQSDVVSPRRRHFGMRVAVFFTPPAKHRLTREAARWLMRDAFTDSRFDADGDGAFDVAELEALTAEPRRYGFHATMKAPFRLIEGAGLEDAE